MKITISRLLTSAITASALLAACGDDETGETPNEPQPIDYYQAEISAELGGQGNQARCSTCHSNDGTTISGGTMKDIAYRASYKGGDAPNLLAGINACVTGWMGGTALTAEDPGYQGLLEYFQSISSPSVTAPNPLAPEVLENEAAYEAAYAGGDAARGESVYTAKCGNCHDNVLVVGPKAALPTLSLKGYSIGRIAQKVRTSGPPPSGSADASDSTPGPMPFFEPSDLSAGDLKDVIAYLRAQ
jgi:cytochrome c5